MLKLRQARRFSSCSLLHFGLSAENTLLAELTAENKCGQGCTRSKQIPRQVSKAHFTYVRPEQVTTPKLVYASSKVAALLGIVGSDVHTTKFTSAFSGNTTLPGLETGYATVYGCHSHGKWLGQLGDGRAISIGEVLSPVDNLRLELQLKGAGTTPFSRGFDGRAVLRSSIRELLASEAMHHLRVPTTRALSVIATEDKVRRKWYSEPDSPPSSPPHAAAPSISIRHRGVMLAPHPPSAVLTETVAVLCRVASSFFRFSHIELFAKKKERKLLIQLADHILRREFSHLLPPSNTKEKEEGCNVLHPKIYIAMFREIVKRSMRLVTEWMRVGYCQGNMNSDNTHIAGLTLDYGPFAWMEKYSPEFQPFTSDITTGNFNFDHQAAAMKINLETLGESFNELIRAVCLENSDIYTPVDIINYIDEVNFIVQNEILQEYSHCFERMVQQKLGVGYFNDDVYQLWHELEVLMMKSEADYTMLFRSLAEIVATSARGERALDIIRPTLYDPTVLLQGRGGGGSNQSGGQSESVSLETAWLRWLDAYAKCCEKDPAYMSPQARAAHLNLHNPKYILRNWMAALAYQQAEEQGEYTLVKEIAALLENPYDEGSKEAHLRWYAKTPAWAEGKPGVAFLS